MASPLATLAPADRLIAAALSPGRPLAAAIASLREQGLAIDWGVVAARADALHMSGPLHQAVCRLPIETLPLAAAERAAVGALALALRRQYISAAVESQLLREQLGEILREAEHFAIPVILLKGVHLANFAYQDPEERSMSDIDLLVRTGDLDRFEAMLHRIGYRPISASPATWRDQHFHLCPLVHPAHRHSVEVHWALTHRGGRVQLDIAAIWTRAEPISIDDHPALALAPTDNLVYLVVHGFFIDKLRYKSLRQIRDLAALLSRESERIDWQVVIERAVALDLRRHLYLAFALVRSVTGVVIPEAAMARLRPADWDEALVDEGCQRLFWSTDPVQYPRMIAAWKDAGFAGVVHTVGDWMSPDVLSKTYGHRRHAWMLYLHLPHRTASWVARRWRVMWRMLIGDPALRLHFRRVAALDAWLD